ncbi:MAG TPA: CocE/NonD family hydrolase [bacterium]|nr:CocE/NonD family hydrolase [bacterium]
MEKMKTGKSSMAYVCSAPCYGVSVKYNVMMPLRDGVRLAMDIYFPSLDGKIVESPFPVVLLRTPYNKTEASNYRYFAERGYIVVTQDVRGRYASEGVFYPFANEGPDGYDTVEWIASQPWCSGKVGTSGGSYCAAVQSALASLNPPHLSAMIPTYGPSSYFHSSMRQNGALEMRFFVYAFLMASTSREAAADPLLKAALDEAYKNIWEWVKAYPVRKGETPLSLIPSYEQWAIDISTRVVYDEYWKRPGYGPLPHYDVHADVPALYIAGWYDTYARASFENFIELNKRKKKPVHILAGPWTHTGGFKAVAGDMSSAPEGGLTDIMGVELRWFDHWLKGLPTGVDREKRVKYFVMGGGKGIETGNKIIFHGGEWKSTDEWPPKETCPVSFYLHPAGILSSKKPAEGDFTASYNFDPSEPVPTIGGSLSAIPLPAGGFDQRGNDNFIFIKNPLPLSSRHDILSFITDPLKKDLIVAGPVRVNIWVATDGPDTDFTAKLIDVFPPSPNYPHGAALNLTDSILRLRFRNGFEKEELAIPGKVYEISFELYPTANRFVKGHRMRLDISSSNFPRFDVNPNTGGPLGVERRKRTAVNTVYYGASKPSCVILHVSK